jgi:hypothetical protein
VNSRIFEVVQDLRIVDGRHVDVRDAWHVCHPSYAARAFNRAGDRSGWRRE